jgi:hypothetical protein
MRTRQHRVEPAPHGLIHILKALMTKQAPNDYAHYFLALDAVAAQ